MKRSAPLKRTPLRRDTGKATLSVKPPKKKRCAKGKGGCGEWFTAARQMQAACSPRCAEDMAALKRMRAERKADALKREKIKPRKDLQAEAQTAFNKYIRLRDTGLPCIDCGQPFEPQKPGGSVDAGHFLSRGSAPHLKFDERNCFAQRKNCNRPGGTTREAFRAGVLARIGREALEALESDQSVKKYTADDLRAIRDTYRAKVRALSFQPTNERKAK